MGWRSPNGVFLAVFFLVLSSTVAQEGLEQTTQSAVAESNTSGTLSPVDVREEESNTQDPSVEDKLITESPSADAQEIEGNEEESERSTDEEIQPSKASAAETESGALASDVEDSESIARTTAAPLAPEETVESGILKDEASNVESPSPNVVDTNETQINESEITEPTPSQLLIETGGEGPQEAVKFSSQVDEGIGNSEAVGEYEKNTVVEPEYVESEKVDYSSWRVYTVEGFGSPPSPALRDQSETEEPSDNDDFDLLVQLEENPKVRVLHENLLQNFLQLAVSPDADSRADVLSSLESRGFSVQDTEIDLGQLIADAEDGGFRSTLPKGAVTFDSYMTYDQIEDFITEFANLHPQVVTKSEIGKSVEGRAIHMLTLTLGASSNRNFARKSRQVPLEPDQPYPAVGETLKALDRIIKWSDSQTDDEDLREPEGDGRPEKVFDRISGSRKREGGPAPGFLEHMMYNMPYEVINEDEPFSGVVSDTYSTLNKIINITEFEDEDYALIDFPNEPPEVQVAYKVLQKIMNYDQDDRARKLIDYAEKIGDIGVGSNRIAKSLGAQEATSETETDPGTNDIDDEAEILFIVTSIIPSEYADNKTMIESISDSVRIIMRNVPRGDALTDEVVQRIAPQIVQIPGVVGIASDSTRSKFDLVSKLDKILRSRNTLLNSNKSDQFLNDQEDPGAALRASSNKPVIFIDGGIHAREWISPAFVMYAATQLVENTDLLLGAEWRLVPVLNPDGYVHTWKSDRMWRKNRGQGSQWCRGVDLNRNFGYKHGGKGSSSNHCSEIYRGPSAFSEPESQALKSAVESVKDRMKAYVTVHSYGQMILHPWGYDNKVHPDSEKMAAVGTGMSDAMRSVNGEKYVVGNAAEVLYPAAGGSDDWVSSLGVPYSFTLELRDTGSKGFILPATQILPTVKETWAGIKYLGQQVIQETPRLKSATAPTAPTALSQTGLDMLAALQGVGITASQKPFLQAHPSLVPVDQDAPSKFRSGIQDIVENPSSSSFPVAPLVPILSLNSNGFKFGYGQRQELSGGAPPNAHFKQTSNVGLPRNDLVSQTQHGIVLVESEPNISNGPFLLSHFAKPAFQYQGFQNQEQSKVAVNQGQIQETNKFRDSLQEHQAAVSPSFSPYPILRQNHPQFNVPSPILVPVSQFLPGIRAESQFGGSVVPYNSPMVIKPSFFGSEVQNDQLSFRYHPSTVGSQAHQVTKFFNDATQKSQNFNPSFRVSDQPFRPILQPLPASPAQAHFKTNIHAVTAPEVPETEPKFAHPFLDSPNILVSVGSPQSPDPNAFRYEISQNGGFPIIEYPRSIRRRASLYTNSA